MIKIYSRAHCDACKAMYNAFLDGGYELKVYPLDEEKHKKAWKQFLAQEKKYPVVEVEGKFIDKADQDELAKQAIKGMVCGEGCRL